MFNEQQLNKLYQYAYALTRNKDDAYDLVYTCVERYLRLNSPKQEAMAYLKRSIKNAFIDQIKSSAHQKEVFYEEAVSAKLHDNDKQSTSTVDNFLELDTNCLEELLINEQEVIAFTEHLNAEENELLYYWAVEGYTVQELSEVTGKPRGTLLSKLHRIRKKAEQFLAKHEAIQASLHHIRSNT
ncbi:RNA polymerase sigma factor [Litoribrevibacter euphylliae]|uniref:RNA polymerase sigma factor n=1 Tax=Litoribrevibacter euphylliae TaxID=1834034 RepID=A0ABV7HFN1_9GAMM